MKATTATATKTTYLHIQRQRDRYGNIRLYWRHAHLDKPVKCIGEEGSPEFDRQYHQLNAELAAWREQHSAQQLAAPKTPKPIAYLPGSIGSVIDHFEVSKKFLRRKPGTQSAYRSAFRLMKAEIGGCILTDLDERRLMRYLEKIDRDNGPARAHMQQVTLSILWRFSKTLVECKHKGRANPAREIGRDYKVARPHPAWPDKVQRHFLDGDARRGVEPAPDYLVEAFYLLKYTGQRRSDVVRMQPEHYNAKTRVLLVEAQVKTGVRVPLTAHSQLMPALRNMLARGTSHLLVNANGEPWEAYGAGLTHAIAHRMRKLGYSPKEYTVHGLRKTAAVACAHAGVGMVELMRIFGWTNAAQALNYLRDADAEKLISAGIAKWEKAEQRKLKLVKSA